MRDAHILVVDDEPEILALLREALAETSYTVLTASNAIEAELLLESGDIDLALLDVGAHGLRLAQQAEAAGIRVILMSGAPVVVEMGEFGTVLQKPLDVGVLCRIIDRTLRRGERRAGSPDIGASEPA
jgi:DNA-binding response OmpR family regulator